MKKEQFKWYILEEVLSYLIRTSGYRTINKAPHNDPDLTDKHNGLNIKWRGANHQIDVLGELNRIPTFDFPIRLIVEAKFRNNQIGIWTIREQVGLLSDINENYFASRKTAPKPRYRYVSAVFSTSWFTEPAVDMAVAHQIQLADLSSVEYDKLRQLINDFTNGMFWNTDNLDKDEVKKIRNYIRQNFWWENQNIRYLDDEKQLCCNKFLDLIREIYNQLFVGMSKWWFMLLLKSDNPVEFLNYAKNKPTHNINITWNPSDNGKIWTIKPSRNNQDSDYTLSFKLPSALHKRIFEKPDEEINRALEQKWVHFPTISIYYHDQGENKDYIFNLQYNWNQ